MKANDMPLESRRTTSSLHAHRRKSCRRLVKDHPRWSKANQNSVFDNDNSREAPNRCSLCSNLTSDEFCLPFS